jgi:hypothetical protein
MILPSLALQWLLPLVLRRLFSLFSSPHRHIVDVARLGEYSKASDKLSILEGRRRLEGSQVC